MHVDFLPESLFDEFRDAVSDDDLHLVIASRENTPYAGLEWLLPTAVVVFITHSYFDGIFKEMGKDHYSLLKRGLKSLWAKLLGPSAPKLAVVSTPGKRDKNQPYSLIYSIVADAAPGLKFKLLFPTDVSESEYDETLAAFLQFLKDFHCRMLGPQMADRLQKARVVGSTLLLVYDKSDCSLRVLDPMPKSGA
jgi:hypothetical protein